MVEVLGSIKNQFKRKKYQKLLAFIVAGTASTAGYALAPESEVKVITDVDATLLEVKTDIAKDANGNIAVRATAAGIAAMSTQAATDATKAAEPEVKTPFEIETGVPLPPIQRGGVRNDVYPFDKLAVGQSFFVPATAKRPNPAKSLASTVSSATRRYKGNGNRCFTIRAVESPVKGARIYRVDDKAPAAAAPAAAAPVAS